MQPIWAWFQHPSTRRHQLELILALILSITMMPVLYMAWAYAVLDVAPNVNWTVAMVFAPYLLFQTTTWIGFAAYSFWAPRHSVFAIVVPHGITQLELSDLLADAFAPAHPAPPSGSAGTVGGPRMVLPPSAPTNAAVSQHLACMCGPVFTEHKLARVLDPRHRRSTAGPNGITHNMLRNLTDGQRLFLLTAYNEVFRNGSLQDTWRIAMVVPVLKAEKPPRSLTSYRRISLTSVLGKTMKAMALHLLQWITTMSGNFSPQKCGFRALRPTAYVIAVVVGTLEQVLHNRETALLLLLDHPAILNKPPRYDLSAFATYSSMPSMLTIAEYSASVMDCRVAQESLPQ
ncbi:hypothetical protein MRX96_009860 [Rhipicephalus microplus]